MAKKVNVKKMAPKKRLIDAYAFYKKFVNDTPTITMGEQRYVATWRISDLIADSPTVDAVEVVRCKDCKYCERDHTLDGGGDEYYYCWNCVMEHGQARANEFCSYGERRPDGQ